MRILFVTFTFPPFNGISAVRTGKLARDLLAFGHDVQVLTAQIKDPLTATLPREIPAERVTATNWVNLARFVNPVLSRLDVMSEDGRSRKLAKFVRASRMLLHMPDHFIGVLWMPFALAAGTRLIEQWRPDVIYASSPIPSALIIASKLAQQHDLPWVGEFRDLWVDHQSYTHPYLRRRLEEKYEARVLNTATGLVAVSGPWAERLREKYHKPTAVVMNGFDPADYPESARVPYRDGRIHIAYTGSMYGRRDVAPLFKALCQMGDESDDVRLIYYGRNMNIVKKMAQMFDYEHLVRTHATIPYHESLKVQMQADVLLMLLWNDPRERGWMSGKIFEYIGARRPVLAIGGEWNAAAHLIRERQAGVALDNPREIAAQLREWLRIKRETGGIPGTPAEASAGLTRTDQHRILDSFLRELLGRD
jgi:glycosyltransferase involved in cell wall biosynthesis